jgi:hypothetical protein
MCQPVTAEWVGEKMSAVSIKAVEATVLPCPRVPPYLAVISVVNCIPELAHGHFSELMLMLGSAMISNRMIQLWQVQWLHIWQPSCGLPLLASICVAAHRRWLTEGHVSWTMYQNKYWDCQCINWASHICSRGFPDSPFKRNNHDGDIVMVFSSIPLRYI